MSQAARLKTQVSDLSCDSHHPGSPQDHRRKAAKKNKSDHIRHLDGEIWPWLENSACGFSLLRWRLALCGTFSKLPRSWCK